MKTVALLVLIGLSNAVFTAGNVDGDDSDGDVRQVGGRSAVGPSRLAWLMAETEELPLEPSRRQYPPSIQLSEVRPLQVDYQGTGSHRLEQGLVTPTALAAGDFDEDGVPDLICGYASPDGNVVTLHRGNLDAIFPHSAAARQRKAEQMFTDAPFLPEVRVFDASGRPDFVGAGDFDNDGHQDLVTAARGGGELYLLPGDGTGGLGPVERLHLPGEVTALIVGEINRADGLADLAVGIIGSEGPVVLVFEGPNGALRGKPEAVSLPAPATALALGRLDDDGWIDLALATGRELSVVYGRDRRLSQGDERRAEVGSPVMDVRGMPSPVDAFAVGNFRQDPGSRRELAVWLENGTVRMLRPDGTMTETGAQTSAARPDGMRVGRRLLSARVSGLPTDDLLALSQTGRDVVLFSGEAWEAGLSVSTGFEGRPVDVLSMRLDGDASSDLVILTEEAIEPLVLMSGSGTTLTVDSAADLGDLDPGDGTCWSGFAGCTLRAAIEEANALLGADTIHFSIATGVQTIAPTSALPPIVDSVVIDGTTQGCASPPCIVLDGIGAGTLSYGLKLAAGSSTIRGLIIQRFNRSGIEVTSSGNIVEGNFIGTDSSGTVDLGNNWAGVDIIGASFNTIGGTVPQARNIISGNQDQGVYFWGATENAVHGNFIGTDVSGSALLGNVFPGVLLTAGSSENFIGGTTLVMGNIIAGTQVASGIVLILDSMANRVQGNLVHNNASDGIAMTSSDNTIGGTAPEAGNVIMNNGLHGIDVVCSTSPGCTVDNPVGNVIQGNHVYGSAGNGVEIEDSVDSVIGGAVEGARNVIRGNYFGVEITGSSSIDNQVLGNVIGGSHYGDGNIWGVLVNDASRTTIGGTTEGAGNVVSGNSLYGVIILGGQSNMIQGNLIGTDESGTSAAGNAWGVYVSQCEACMIGGAAPGAGNVISGNSSRGVDVYGSIRILGNFIGTDVSGTSDLGNDGDGVIIHGPGESTLGGTDPGAGNVISGNSGNGVFLLGEGTQVLGNLIGTDVNGIGNLGNTQDGIRITNGSGHAIGGMLEGAGNLIKANGGSGVVMVGNVQDNAVLGNSIHSNGGMGIDLGIDGTTPNDPGDPDSGPNLLQNFPVLTAATVEFPATTVGGMLNSTPDTDFRLEFFANNACDDSAYGEGKFFLGFLDVTTDGSGNFDFGASFPASASSANRIAATATDSAGNTSEFSGCLTAECLSLQVFEETITTPDRDHLSWDTPQDVRFVKGNLADVSSYGVMAEGLLFDNTSLDTSGDNPAPGAGLYYLVRYPGCGSWQTASGSEPGRDTALP